MKSKICTKNCWIDLTLFSLCQAAFIFSDTGGCYTVPENPPGATDSRVFLWFKWSLSTSCVWFRSYKFTVKHFALKSQCPVLQRARSVLCIEHQHLPLEQKLIVWVMSMGSYQESWFKPVIWPHDLWSGQKSHFLFPITVCADTHFGHIKQ